VRGEGGFGYDPIFYVPEKKLTFAQMSPELKKSISHRGHALRKIIPQLLEVD
jgi:XTP/dITP diphosphohydrolase